MDVNSHATDTYTLWSALQRVVNGDDPDPIVDEVLATMTRREDAARLFPGDGRARRRIENRLRHASANYAKVVSGVYDLFREAIEAEGLKVSPEFSGERQPPLPKMADLIAAQGVKFN